MEQESSNITTNVNTQTIENNKQPIEQNKSNKKKICIIIGIIAILLIGIGIYVLYFQNNKRIIGKAIDNIKESAENYYMPNYEVEQFDAYTSESDIKLDIKSNYLKQMSTYSTNLVPYTNLIQNLNKTTNKVVIKQDNSKEKAYLDLNSSINNNELLSVKYLIENNTEYYYVKGFLDKYINNGTSNYFEALNQDTTSKDNMEYVYEFAISSFKNNLKEEYFTKKGEKVEINGKEKTLQKVSLEIDNDRLIEIAKAILKDLKEDKKANEILTGLDKDFKDAKVKSNEYLLEDDQKIIFSVYVDNITYAIKKYKFDLIEGSDIGTITYERNEQGIVNLYTNDKLEGTLVIEYKDSETILTLKENDSESVGRIIITKNDNMYGVSISIKDEDADVSLSLKQEIKDVDKGKSYKAITTVTGDVKSNEISLADIKILINSKVIKGAEIKENTDNAVFASDITSDKEQALQQQLTNVIMKLMS